MAVERTQVTNACLEEPRSGRNLSPKRGGGDRREGQKVTDTRTTAHYITVLPKRRGKHPGRTKHWMIEVTSHEPSGVDDPGVLCYEAVE